jgi:diacylglycerol kinase family enzyme
MLVIVNPHATSTSERLRKLVLYALGGRFEVDAVDTQRKGHAIELCREAAGEGYDLVVTFGGDGTVNEAANGLAGTGTPLFILPGGSNNVLCRILGIPDDVVDATGRLLEMADALRPRDIDLARVNDRWFTFSAGVGLDASVVERVDQHPQLKRRLGPWYFTGSALSTFLRRYVVHPPDLEVRVGDRRRRGVSAMIQNARPYTYFERLPIDLAEGATLDSGDLAGVVLTRASALDLPTIAWRALSPRARMSRHRRVAHFTGAHDVVARSLDGRAIPLQVDGDHIGETLEARFSVTPRALRVVA